MVRLAHRPLRRKLPDFPHVSDKGITHPIAASTALVTSIVFALPPRSGVRERPAFNTAPTAARIEAAERSRPRCSSSSAADRIAASGLATPLPAMSGAEPWTGSNKLGYVRSGLRLALAARPRLPTETMALRSVR